jgi:hypothetical protein
MLQARQAIVQRSWSHPLEDSSDDWWADVLADPRARRQACRSGLLKDRLELGSLRRVFCRTYRWAAMTTLPLRRMKDDFIVTGPDIEPTKFKSRREAKDWCTSR